VTRTEQIFDLLLKEKQLELTAGHQIPSANELKGCKYSKWHNTVNFKALRQQIQSTIEQGRLVYTCNQMKVNKMSFPHVNMAEVAPTQQQSPSRESSAPFQQIRSAIEQGRFITRATRGEHGSPTFPSINMVSVARSAKGKEKADPDDDQPLEFKPEHHVSVRKIKRNHRSRPNSGALIRMYVAEPPKLTGPGCTDLCC